MPEIFGEATFAVYLRPGMMQSNCKQSRGKSSSCSKLHRLFLTARASRPRWFLHATVVLPSSAAKPEGGQPATCAPARTSFVQLLGEEAKLGFGHSEDQEEQHVEEFA